MRQRNVRRQELRHRRKAQRRATIKVEEAAKQAAWRALRGAGHNKFCTGQQVYSAHRWRLWLDEASDKARLGAISCVCDYVGLL